jgi:GTP cyclohydrolase I
MAGPQPELFRELLEQLGEDPTREGLRETPSRVAKAFVEWTSGYNQDPAAILKCFEEAAEKYDEMVFQGNIEFYSLCEHHLAPFFGTAYIAYIPNGRVVGLSKLPRLVDVFARRLQVQERMTRQIAEALNDHLEPLGVAVVLRARHLCMESRGIRRSGALTTTSAVLGVFRDRPEVRAEFFSLARLSAGDGQV